MLTKHFYKVIAILVSLHPVWAMQGNSTTTSTKTSPHVVHTDKSGLPIYPEERDRMLKKLYNVVIPKLLATQTSFWWLHATSNTVNILTPFPYNPYRVPDIDKLYFLPGNAIEFEDAVKTFTIHENIHTKMIQAIDRLVHTAEQKLTNTEKASFLMRGLNPTLIKSLLVRPVQFDQKVYTQHAMNQFQATQNPEKLLNFTIYQEDIPLLIQLKSYHEVQRNKIKDFMDIAASIPNPVQFFDDLYLSNSPRHTQAKALYLRLKPYFLKGRKSISQLMTTDILRRGRYKDAEVIIIDSFFSPSKYLSISNPSIEKPFDWRNKLHGTAVAGVIGGKEELEQVQGIAPGVKTLLIKKDNLYTDQALEVIKNSSARVINMSIKFKWPKVCFDYFQEKNSPQNTTTHPPQIQDPLNGECKALWQFAELVQEKDMILVRSAGNEGLQIEKVDWKTGKIEKDRTNRALGMQYYGPLQTDTEGNMIDLSHIYKQIPQLKNRVILVGNLLPDGVTITPSSSLPGFASLDFIFAQGEQILSLYPAPINITKNSKEFYSVLGPFGGTSSAAPRVTGTLVLLGSLFPDLSMTKIRRCVLDNGDPFWEDSLNGYEWIKSVATTPYGKAIYGKGRLNPVKAYECCLERQADKNRKVLSPSRLELIESSKEKFPSPKIDKSTLAQTH